MSSIFRRNCRTINGGNSRQFWDEVGFRGDAFSLTINWPTIRKIIRDVGPTLSPDDELGDIAAAEGAVNAKDTERAEVVDALRDELKRMSSAFDHQALLQRLPHRDDVDGNLSAELTRQHHSAAVAAQRPFSHPTPSEHDSQVRLLEQQQYAVGKQLNEEQAAVAKKEVELGKWKGEKEEVGRTEVGEDGWVDGKMRVLHLISLKGIAYQECFANAIIWDSIRLRLLSGAGLSLIPSSDPSVPNKILIRMYNLLLFTPPKRCWGYPERCGPPDILLLGNDAKSDVHTVPIDASRSKVYNANLIWGLASE